MKRFSGLLVAIAAGLACHSDIAASQSACMEAEKPGAWVAGGQLAQRTYKDAAGRPGPAYILTMPQTECLHGQNEGDNVQGTRTVQLYSSDSRIERTIRRFVGKTVMVEGRAFGAATLHHHAPIVVDVSSIDLP